MNAKQEAEKYLEKPWCRTENGKIIIPFELFKNLLKELEATERRNNDLHKVIDNLSDSLYSTERKLAEAEKVIGQFCDIYNESEGVTGLHLNGEVATWEWLRDNEWLDSLSDYEASKGE